MSRHTEETTLLLLYKEVSVRVKICLCKKRVTRAIYRLILTNEAFDAPATVERNFCPPISEMPE